MYHYQFYLVLPETAWDNLVPAHFSLPVDANYATYDAGNRDIIFGDWNRDVDGNPTTWRRPTWREAAVGVAGVHGPQLGPRAIWTYTYASPPGTLRWGVTKFVHPHLPSAMPRVSGGLGLFSLYENAELSDNVTRTIDSTIQECIDDKSLFYSDAIRLREWSQAEVAAGNLNVDS